MNRYEVETAFVDVTYREPRDGDLLTWRDVKILKAAQDARIAALKDALAALRDLAADAVSGLRYIEQQHGRLYGVGWDRVYDKDAAQRRGGE